MLTVYLLYVEQYIFLSEVHANISHTFSRYQQIKIGVSGVAPVKVQGVENIDLTHIVTQVSTSFNHKEFLNSPFFLTLSLFLLLQHIHYNLKMKEILEEINLSSSLPHGEASFGVYEGSSNTPAFGDHE